MKITSKFTANYDAVEESLKSKAIGLISLGDMRELQKDVIVHRDLQKDTVADKIKEEHVVKNTEKRVLSFGDDEEDEEEVFIPKKRVGMDPNVDTSFLPDKEREEELAKKKEELAAEWREQQEREKNEEILVAYAAHDFAVFLNRAIEALKKEFTEIKTCTPENLMFVKEDLIIPHFYTFQDFIVTKAMGKTGPLFVFEAAADVRIRQDAALDYGEAHPAKVVLRSWYEKNKHIYPASRWEPFVASKKYGKDFDDLSDL
ncbi:unnamed protein product [Caenorhabditis auriculariae]|uniref:Protein FAM50 homolog n=1 Tax=Caenorhabditis auriculariae TaxID=2777116 RepID=A0A8S1GUM3_9PELO|nr:unnamed protein product [Caenorhabditis auriculariae]